MAADLRSIPIDRVALADWGKRSLAKIGVKEALFDEEDDPKLSERRWENALELANALGQMEVESKDGVEVTSLGILSEFLQAMTLDPRDDEEEDESYKDEVTLLTLHGSKGLEFPVVFLVGTEEGYLPHQRTIDGTGPEAILGFDEERRLAYVGITRAKSQLILTRAKFRIRYGKKVPRLISRFIADIPKELLLIQDESEAPEPTTKEAQEAHETKVKDFLAEIRSRIAASGK